MSEPKSLQELPNLAGFSLVQLEKFAAHSGVKNFARGEIIFDQDTEGRYVYLLTSGVVSASYISPERQTLVQLLAPGEFFGLDSLIAETRHRFRCEAFEDCKISFIKPQLFVEIFFGASYEDFLPGYRAALAPGYSAYVHCIQGIGLDLRRRLALELLNLADHFGAPDPDGTSIGLNLSHELIASIVGASRQQVTEYLNDFDREGAICRKGRRIIIDADRLRKVLEYLT